MSPTEPISQPSNVQKGRVIVRFFRWWNRLPVVIALTGVIGLMGFLGGIKNISRDVRDGIDWMFNLTE